MGRFPSYTFDLLYFDLFVEIKDLATVLCYLVDLCGPFLYFY